MGRDEKAEVFQQMTEAIATMTVAVEDFRKALDGLSKQILKAAEDFEVFNRGTPRQEIERRLTFIRLCRETGMPITFEAYAQWREVARRLNPPRRKLTAFSSGGVTTSNYVPLGTVYLVNGEQVMNPATVTSLSNVGP